MENKDLEQEYVDSYYSSDRREGSLPIIGCTVEIILMIGAVMLGVWVANLIF